ncbi:magnesium transporter CorA family protein [Oscillospiraceae bacterium OttesenSCG-928-G22]|nr:magnesium transporter CorA family protein [Oscillospiraceae bacterium OttesenSCG-928-G22]
MLSILHAENGRIQPTNDIVEGVWINLTNPSEAELKIVEETVDVDPSFLRAALDEEETSRVETEGNEALIIIDVPSVETETQVTYSTIPLGIIVTETNIITVCLKETSVIREFEDGLVRGVDPSLKTRFIFTVLLKIATRFLQYLRQIDKMSNYVERQLYKSQRNKELIQLLALEKSLLFFSTSLKANEGTLEKIMRGRVIKLYDEDQDLLEDVLIEVRQAIEMANIYTSILSGTMDAYASVISNNLNVIMKTLTSITILFTIPNIIFGFYGMNVSGLPFPNPWFPILIALICIGVTWFILKKKDLF